VRFILSDGHKKMADIFNWAKRNYAWIIVFLIIIVLILAFTLGVMAQQEIITTKDIPAQIIKFNPIP
jgi:hypothetical protein